jgi:hypothetical protein
MLSFFSCSPIKHLHKIYPTEEDKDRERQVLEKSSNRDLNDSTVIRHIQISEAKQDNNKYDKYNENKSELIRQHTVIYI